MRGGTAWRKHNRKRTEEQKSTFTPEELTLICLYDPGTRLGAVEELRNMMQYLMVDETELTGLTLRVIAKLEAMSDAGYKQLSAEIIPDFSPIISG